MHKIFAHNAQNSRTYFVNFTFMFEFKTFRCLVRASVFVVEVILFCCYLCNFVTFSNLDTNSTENKLIVILLVYCLVALRSIV